MCVVGGAAIRSAKLIIESLARGKQSFFENLHVFQIVVGEYIFPRQELDFLLDVILDCTIARSCGLNA